MAGQLRDVDDDGNIVLYISCLRRDKVSQEYISQYNEMISKGDYICSNGESMTILPDEELARVNFYGRGLPLFPKIIPLRFAKSILEKPAKVNGSRIVARKIESSESMAELLELCVSQSAR